MAEYIDWYNHRRLHGELGLVPPVEYEDHHALTQPVRQPAGGVTTQPPANPALDSQDSAIPATSNRTSSPMR